MDSQNDSVIIKHDASSKLESDPNFKSPINRGKKVTVTAGDSIIKNIQGWRLSTLQNHVVVKSFAGATSTDMEDYLRPIIRKEPHKINLHVETNDISHQPASRVAQGIANLGTQIVQDSPATSIVISSILPRTYKPELSKKVIEANKLLQAFCDQNNWDFMNHTTTIDSSSNLNRKGTTAIASHISNYIHNPKLVDCAQSVSISSLTYTGCLKKMVIELWSALARSRNHSFTVGKTRLLAFECHHFCEI